MARRRSSVPDLRVVHTHPSEDVSTAPSFPTTTNTPLPKATPCNRKGVPAFWFVHDSPSTEVCTMPFGCSLTLVEGPKAVRITFVGVVGAAFVHLTPSIDVIVAPRSPMTTKTGDGFVPAESTVVFAASALLREVGMNCARLT